MESKTANPWNQSTTATPTVPTTSRDHQDNAIELVTTFSQCTILVLTMLCNLVFILSLKVRPCGGLKLVDKLMLNTVVCNVLLVVISIPVDLSIGHIHDYPFTNFVCTLVDPISTYCLNCCVFTYVVIAIERYVSFSFITYLKNSLLLRLSNF